jgi:hypothetical protein
VVAQEGHPALGGLGLGRGAPGRVLVASRRTSARTSAAARGRPRRPRRESQFQ